MECSNCEWKWDIEKDDTNPYLCHRCGYDGKLKKFDKESLKKWEIENDFPFEEKIVEGFHMRKFLTNVDNQELVWHRDKEDRIVKSVDYTDWMVQIDNQLPKSLTETIYIPKNTYHRLIKGTGDIILKVKKIQ
jgi:hypothetical protein